MARKNYQLTEKTLARFEREARGRGVLGNYRPLLEVGDVPSKGRSHRPLGSTTGREHHLLSDCEYQTFVPADWDNRIRDIREQYPLDRWATHRLALLMGIRPSLLPEGTPYPMTTDFLMNFWHEGREILIARSCKVRADLKERRVREILELEKRYWTERGVHWALVVKEDIDQVLFRNIDYVRFYTSLEHVTEPYPDSFSDLIQLIPQLLLRAPDMLLVAWCRELDRHFEVPEHTCLKVFRHLLATKRIVTDMRVKPEIESRRTTAFAISPAVKRWPQ